MAPPAWIRILRIVLWIYAVLSLARHYYQWRTANLPHAEGGKFDNPFNDPDYFCCVYGADPCPRNVVCITEEGLAPTMELSPFGLIYALQPLAMCYFLGSGTGGGLLATVFLVVGSHGRVLL